MTNELTAQAYYAISPAMQAVIAFGPIIKDADGISLQEAHDFIDEAKVSMLAEVRYPFDDKNIVHSALYMPNGGYEKADIPVGYNGLVSLRKMELLKMPMSIQSKILRAALDGVVEDSLVDRIDSLYRMNIPLSAQYLKLLGDNAIFGTFSENNGLIVDTSRRKHTVNELLIHLDKWYLQEDPSFESSDPGMSL